MSKPKFHCKSKAQKKAIRANYAKKYLVNVVVKTHQDNNGGHPHIIVDDIDNKHISVGLTTKPKKGKNSPNYKLEQSPLNDGKQSYMRRQGTVASTSEYTSPRKGEMTSNDYLKAKEYGEKAKQKYLDKKYKKSNDVPNT